MAAPSAPVPVGAVDLGLRGTAIIVTGAGSGIGAATARQLGAAGASVVLVGRRAEALAAQAELITTAGGVALCVPADLAEPDSPDRIAAACRARYGRIDGAGEQRRRRPAPADRRLDHRPASTSMSLRTCGRRTS